MKCIVSKKFEFLSQFILPDFKLSLVCTNWKIFYISKSLYKSMVLLVKSNRYNLCIKHNILKTHKNWENGKPWFSAWNKLGCIYRNVKWLCSQIACSHGTSFLLPLKYLSILSFIFRELKMLVHLRIDLSESHTHTHNIYI